MKTYHHITIHGRPLCKHPELLHFGGGIPQCEFRTAAAARAAATLRRRGRYGRGQVAVVKGECPEARKPDGKGQEKPNAETKTQQENKHRAESVA